MINRQKMSFQKPFSAAWILAALTLFAISLAAQNETYKARLSPVPADAKTRPDLAGLGTATATLSGTKLTVTGSFDGLKSAATVARLHNGVAAGVRGPSFVDLTVSKSTGGSLSGSADLTPQQLQNLRKGGIYVQIHSEKAPEGVLWGWLVR
jgi:hypothetical protein